MKRKFKKSLSSISPISTKQTISSYPSGAPDFTPGFSGVCVTRSLVLCICFVDHCLSFCTFSFGHCVVCSSLIYGFWLPPLGIFKLFLNSEVIKSTNINKKQIITSHLNSLNTKKITTPNIGNPGPVGMEMELWVELRFWQKNENNYKAPKIFLEIQYRLVYGV